MMSSTPLPPRLKELQEVEKGAKPPTPEQKLKDSLRAHLNSTIVDNRIGVLPTSEVLVLDGEITVETAIKKFKKEKVLSSPVTDTHLKDIGLLDMKDINAHMIQLVKKYCPELLNKDRSHIPHINLQKQLMENASEEYFSTKVKFVKDLSRGNFLFLRRQNDISPSLLQACDLMRDGMHDVVLLHSDNRVNSLVKQANVIAYLVDHDFIYSPLRLADIMAKIHTVSTHTPTLIAFAEMDVNGYGSLGIVDDRGILIGTVEVEDLLHVAHLNELLLPLDKFMKKHTARHRYTHLHTDSGTSVAAAAAEMVENKHQRLIVCAPCVDLDTLAPKSKRQKTDEEEEEGVAAETRANMCYTPAGIVTLTDILRASHPPGPSFQRIESYSQL